jgi:hypothetical protein
VLPVQPAGAPVGTPEANIVAVNDDRVFRDRILGAGFNMARHGIAASFETLKGPLSSKDLVQDLVLLRDVPESAPDENARAGRIDTVVTQLEAEVAAGARRRSAGAIQRSLKQLKPVSEPDGPNLVVSGGRVRIWSTRPVERGRATRSRSAYRVPSDPHGAPVLVEFGDGMFMPVVPYAGLYSVVKRSGGEAYQAYGRRDGRQAFEQALTAIADFAAGRLSPEHVDRFAAQLREGKHADPVLGVICAYLYRALADYDSIRRMAYFYTQHDQPIPFDVVLLGDLKVRPGPSRHLMANVPEVRARKGNGRDGDLPEFVTQRTQAAEGAVGGRCPWAAVGWDYVGLAGRQSAALVEGIAELAATVPRTAFTLLPAETGQRLARAWGLTAR